MRSLGRTVRALIERDFAGRKAFRVGFVLEIAATFFFFAALYYVSRLVPPDRIGGRDYFGLTAIGIGVFGFLGAVAAAPRAFLVGELNRGTLETLLAIQPRIMTYFEAAALQHGARSLLRSLLIFALGGWLSGGMTMRAAPWLLAILAAGALAMFGLGLIEAGIEMKVRKMGRLSGLVTGASVVLTGVYFPISVLPEPLQWIARCIPMTHVIDAARMSLYGESAPVVHVLLLGAASIIFLFAGRFAVAAGHRSLRRTGAYLSY